MLTCNAVHIQQGQFSLNVDAQFPSGQVTAVMGASGAGKSTLLGAIAGFNDIRSGSIDWNDEPISQMAPGKRPVSMLFQDNNLFPHLTVSQNVALGITGKTSGPQDVINDALNQVGLTGFEQRKPSALSGGQQSRVGIARILVSRRPIILLDEPFAALGPALKDEMLGMTRDILARDRSATVLMVTHDPHDARMIADNILWVGSNTVMSPRPTEEVYLDPPEEMKSYLGTFD